MTKRADKDDQKRYPYIGGFTIHFMRTSEKMILILAAAALSIGDNVTTWMAIEAGAIELNLMLAPYLSNPASFLAFTTLIKTVTALYLINRYYSPSRTFYINYMVIIGLFIQTIIANIADIYGVREWLSDLLADSLGRYIPRFPDMAYGAGLLR